MFVLTVAMCSLKYRDCSKDDVPTFIVMKAVRAAGWSSGIAPVVHTDDTLKLFGRDNFVERTAYLKCLWVWAELRRRGLKDLPSNQHQAFYKCVLGSPDPSAIPPDCAVCAYGEDAANMDTKDR